MVEKRSSIFLQVKKALAGVAESITTGLSANNRETDSLWIRAKLSAIEAPDRPVAERRGRKPVCSGMLLQKRYAHPPALRFVCCAHRSRCIERADDLGRPRSPPRA